MGYTIRSPRFSFVQFASQEDHSTCFPADVDFCLPVYSFDDVAFQFIVEADTVAEADALCVLGSSPVSIGLVRNCNQEGFTLNLTDTDQPERFRISDRQVLYNWGHGFAGFDSFFEVGECFYVSIVVGEGEPICSNCFQRIAEDCYTSVIDYGSTQNIFGFNYCGSGTEAEDGAEAEVCEEPTIFQFVDATEIDYEYTAALQAKYGDVPTVEIWIWDSFANQYVKPMIQVGFDAYPPTRILADLGGAATGFMKIS